MTIFLLTMHITYHGLSCIKLVAKTAGRGSDDVTIIFAPYDKDFGLRPLQSSADIVLVPLDGPMFNNAAGLRGDAVVIDRPGEFSAKGINIIGRDAPADLRGGATRGNTVVFVVDVEDMKVAYLGGVGMELPVHVMDILGDIDILFLPVGDTEGLDGKTAEIIARKIEPRIIIPIQYKTKGVTSAQLRSSDDFCDEIGNCPKTAEEKYIVKKADIENVSMRIVTLAVV